MGLSQQVAALETEIFGKVYAKQDLPGRVARLETAVFPSDKAAAEKPLPERVGRLTGAVKISQTVPKPAPRIAQRAKDPDFDDDEDFNSPQLAPQRGLGQIMSQMGSMMGSGAGTGFVGGYSVPSGNMVRDPGTGLLLDRNTGNLIDPNTGMVIGRRISPSPYAVPPVYMNRGFGQGIAIPPMTNGFTPYSMAAPGMGLRGLGGF
jgi:hypothetical protein